MPVFNRNQGNIIRAKLNVTQTQSGLDALESRSRPRCRRADQEYDVTKSAVEQIERELIPAARQVRDTAYRQFIGGEATSWSISMPSGTTTRPSANTATWSPGTAEACST